MAKKLIIDIKPPQNKKTKIRKTSPRIILVTKKEPKKRKSEKEKSQNRKSLRPIFLAIGVLIITVAVFSAIGLFELKNSVAKQAPELYDKFAQGETALKRLDTKKAKNFFEGANNNIQSIKSSAEKYGLLQISEFWGKLMPKTKLIPETFANLANLGETTFGISANLEDLKENGFKWFTNQQGNLLVNNFESIKIYLNKLSNSITFFNNQEFGIEPVSDNGFLSQTAKLAKVERVLDAFIDWLKNPNEKHILIAFQNPSELRPSGGFLGSYADISIDVNGLQDIKVWDIYDPDGQLKINIVPPYELQNITPRWGARDANWFFDFPISAKKIISFLEKSLIYQEQNITFDGLISINIHVIETILKALDSIELETYDLTITPENFLQEIQREVEAGKDKTKGEPKRILKILTPTLFERLSELDESQKIFIFKELQKHINQKDIIFFFKDWKIQQFLEDSGLAGRVYESEENSDGDYLAVVSSNIAGGKTDAYVKTKIKLSSKIEASGRIDNYLNIEKTHTGNTRKEDWYRKTNTSYLKIFTPKDTRLTYIDGQSSKTIKPAINYAKSGYLIDEDLNNVEKTKKPIKEFGIEKFIEAGKTVFGFWFDTPPGKTKKLEMQYFNPKRLILHNNPIPYKFVFEKQSGNNIDFEFIIEAPQGYVWQENNTRFFSYETSNPKSREIIDLTLSPSLEPIQR